MENSYIVVILLTIVGTVTVIILFYFILICITAARAPPMIPEALHRRATRHRAAQAQERAGASGPRRQSTQRATDNVYMTHPTATLEAARTSGGLTTRNIASSNGHATLTIPSSLFFNSQGMGSDMEVLRFYTAEELLNFPFEEHQRQVIASMSAGPASERTQRAPSPIEPPETANMAYPPVPRCNPPNNRQTVFVRRPEPAVSPESNAMIEAHLERRRLCYSFPASYTPRPPTTAQENEQPPAYDDALREVPEEKEEMEGSPLSPPPE